MPDPQPHPSSSFAGKTCLVTGGTSGIGLATARELARQGGTVVITGRDASRAEAAVESIRAESSNPHISFLCADLSSQAEVRRLAREFRAAHSRLDVLINNAGAIFEYKRRTVDGVEMTLALNHLAYFLLTIELLDLLKASSPSRIIVVSSGAHKDVAAFDFDDPQADHPAKWRGVYSDSRWRSLFYTLALPWAHPAFLLYAQSKLANLLFTYELARRLEGTGVTVNALHPGVVATNFSSQGGPYSWFMRRFVSFKGITPEEGAKTVVYLATSSDVEPVSGRYFINEKAAESSPASHDANAARRLWELSEQLTRAGPASAAHLP
ncbi:MAG TPA: SDR family oxidoreductase [Phycisphaerales bacterium]|nr:SDR family oxidoreductase [Phycisphaerales bacterium]